MLCWAIAHADIIAPRRFRSSLQQNFIGVFFHSSELCESDFALMCKIQYFITLSYKLNSAVPWVSLPAP